MRITIFGDSLASTGGVYAGVEQNFAQLLTKSAIFYGRVDNYAVGGSLSGAANAYAYKINDTILEATGLLGQIKLWQDNLMHTDLVIIWSGTNDCVIGAQLDPFESADGYVTTTDFVKNTRLSMEARDNPVLYLEEVVNYTVSNYIQAVTMLRTYSRDLPVVFITPINLAGVPLGNMHPSSKQLASQIHHMLINKMYKALRVLPNCTVVSASKFSYKTVDAIHLRTVEHETVLKDLITTRRW